MDESPPSPGAAAAAAADADLDLMRRRLRVVIPIPAVFLAMALPLLARLLPETRTPLVASYLVELATCVACYVAMRRSRRPSTIAWVALAFGGSFAAMLAATSVLIDVPTELLALTLVCELTGFAVLLPWSVRHQIILSAFAVASLALAGRHLSSASGLELALLGIVAGATSGVFATHFLASSRREAHRRAELLERESARTQEELEISSALLRVADTLSANVGRDEVFAMVNDLAVASVGCQWSATLFLDDASTFRLVAQSGMRPAVAEALAGVPLARGLWPMGRALSRGEMVVIDDAEAQDHAPPDVLRRLDVAAAMFAPIVLGSELVGMIAVGNRDRRGPFSEKQRRLTIGLAQAVAVAVANHRSIAGLQEANRLKSDFVSTMSHELRTPLNVITGYAEILVDPELGRLSEEHAIAARGISRSAAELLDLVTKTLDLSRLELGVDALRLERVAPAELFREVEAELESLARPGLVRLAYAESGDAPMEVATDRGKLKTILKNLIGNALKFTPVGEVAVHASLDGDRLVLRVRDTGIGIAPGDRTAVFEMFRQIASSTTGGVGLGLYIVRRLVDLLGGSLSLASEPGAGSEFTVAIPVRGLGPDLGTSPAARERAPAGSPAPSVSIAPVAGAGARPRARSALARAQRSGYKRGA